MGMITPFIWGESGDCNRYGGDGGDFKAFQAASALAIGSLKNPVSRPALSPILQTMIKLRPFK